MPLCQLATRISGWGAHHLESREATRKLKVDLRLLKVSSTCGGLLVIPYGKKEDGQCLQIGLDTQ